MNPEVNFKRLYDKSKYPFDEYDQKIYSIASAERCYIIPGERKLIKTFLEIHIPEGYAGLITARKDQYIKLGLYPFPEVLLPTERKELQLAVMNVNIPKGPIMMTDHERFFGEKSKIDVYIGDKIANMILLPLTSYAIKEIM